MSDMPENTMPVPNPLSTIIPRVIQVITAPVAFFRAMPKSGGFLDPLIFMAVFGTVTSILMVVISLLGLVMKVSFALAVYNIIAVVIGGFIGAGILFLIWKLMGSQESYETAYRCCAYTMAIAPITTLLGLIPFIGTIIGLVWGLYLVVTASVEVHKIAAKTAWLVFGIISAVLALLSISGTMAAKRMSRQMGNVPDTRNMTPEESGRAMAAFVAEMQKKAQQDAANNKSDE